MKITSDSQYKIVTQILKKYNILIDTEEQHICDEYTPPNHPKNETFKQWKNRIFGNCSSDIYVYARQLPPQQMQMSTILKSYNCEYIKSLLAYCEKKNKKILKQKIEENTINQNNTLHEYEERLNTQYSTIPISTLKSIIDETKDILEPSVSEMLNNFIKSNENTVNIEDILMHIIMLHNNLVKRYKIEKEK